jgi:putative transposase
MPGTYTKILLHVVFATKGRTPWFDGEKQSRVHSFIGGIVRDERCVMIAAGGMPDHMHLLVSMRTDVTVADLFREVKSRSSGWIHETFPDLRDFAWQAGYIAFSVSKSQEAVVVNYLANQAAHHQKRDFKAELTAILDAHGVEYDPKYVFD